MTIKVRDIIDLAESKLSSIAITDVSGVLWTNECLAVLGSKLRNYGSATQIAATSSSIWYDIPSDFLDVDAIEDDTGNRFKNNYLVRNGQIKLSQPGTFTLSYWASHDDATSALSTLTIDARLKPVIANYVASVAKEQDDDKVSELSRRLMDRFEKGANDFANNFDKPGAEIINDVYGGL